MEAKFAVGDRVDQSPHDGFVGTVKAIYKSREGEVRYAVDMGNAPFQTACTVGNGLVMLTGGTTLPHREIAARFQNKPTHAGPMAIGPNTLKGDSHRQKHESTQRLQSVTRGG
jgi:hypothetical protein